MVLPSFLTSTGSGHQRRRRNRFFKPRLDGLIQIVEHAPALLGTGGDHRPDALAPAIARGATRPLRDDAVEHHEADRLFRQVVRWLHPWRGHEPEVRLPVLGE